MREFEMLTMIPEKRRKYAAFYEWPDKQVKEFGIIGNLVEALVGQGIEYREPRINEPDPPDCICIDRSGNLVALEVVELVSQEAIERNQKGETVYRWWEPEDIRTALTELISKKDKKSFNGGPYGDIAVVIHTDEPALTADEVRGALTEVALGPFEQITRAFLIFSYMPGKGHEVLQLLMAAHNKSQERTE